MKNVERIETKDTISGDEIELKYTEPTEAELALEALVEWRTGDALTRLNIALDCADGIDAASERWLLRARYLVELLIAARREAAE